MNPVPRFPGFSVLAVFVACATQRAPVVPPPPPQFTATSTAQRVVLLSFDGLGADALAAQSDLPAFAALARDGASARVIPVNPTVTSTTHVSILTGAQPNMHGIVANRFHTAGTAPEKTAIGLETEIDAETLVESAMRQGKRVGSVPFPTVDGRSPRRRPDFGFAWTSSVTPARILHLTRGDFRREWVPPTWTERPQRRVSFSPIMRARIEWNVPDRVRKDVDLVAYDTSNDSAANYDLFFIETDERESAPDSRGWFAVSAQTREGLYGSWSKLLRIDPSLSDVTILWGSVARTDAWPSSFQTMLDTQIGFWPGVPNERLADTDTSIEQMQRLGDFLTHAQVLAIRGMTFDLLLAYQPQVDSTAHNYLGDARPIRESFVATDRAIAAMRATLDLTRDALIVTGDHGVAAIEFEVRMNRWLADKGFAPRWRAFASGNIAHLYRFAGSDDADALIAALQTTGFFDEIGRKSHPNSGDVVATARPNVNLTMSDEAPAVTKPASKGQHGALNTHRELHTVLFAAGAGVPRGTLGEVSQTRIARFVAQLLGIQPPAAAE